MQIVGATAPVPNHHHRIIRATARLNPADQRWGWWPLLPPSSKLKEKV